MLLSKPNLIRSLSVSSVNGLRNIPDRDNSARIPACFAETIGSSLTIGACLLPGYIEELNEKCPHIKASITIDNTDQIVRLLLQGSLDIGLVEGTVNDEALMTCPFMKDRLIAICGCAHPFSNGAPVDLIDFCKQPLLLRERGSGTREIFQSATTLKGLQIEPAWESISTTALIRAVEAGRGVSVLPEKLVSDAILNRRIVCVNLQSMPLSRQLYLVYHKHKYLSTGLSTFVSIVTKELGM